MGQSSLSDQSTGDHTRAGGPQEIPLRIMNVIAFFAHPDDETMLIGGTLALLARNGAQVHYLCATRGEGGEVGEPPLCTVEELGQKRERELGCAVQSLGGSSLTFLDFIDPHTGPEDELYAFSDNQNMLSDQIIEFIQKFNAEVVITHGSSGEYGHPAHLLSYRAAKSAISSLNGSNSDRLLYTVSAAFSGHPKPRLANQDDPAHLVIDVSPALGEKTAAAMCHETQHALFVRRSSREAGRQLTVSEVIMPIESLHRVYPDVEDEPEDVLTQALKPWDINHRAQN